jgi:polyisoprenoid-binding protein YceI
MKNKILILIGLLGLVILFLFRNEIWGEPESKLEKTEISNKLALENNEKSLDFRDISGTKWVNQKNDPKSAEIGFTIDGDLKETKGFFEKFDMVFKVAENGDDNAKMKVIIEIKSINTENEIRDKALMEDDFFNAEKYPSISYYSKNIKRMDNDYVANGILEMMGKKSELSFKFKHKGIVQNSKQIDVAIFEGELEIDRTLFGMEHTPSVGDLVKLNFYCELIEEK